MNDRLERSEPKIGLGAETELAPRTPHFEEEPGRLETEPLERDEAKLLRARQEVEVMFRRPESASRNNLAEERPEETRTKKEESFGIVEKFKMGAMRFLTDAWPPADKWLQKRAEWIIEESGIIKYLKPGGVLLDIGCGKGHILSEIAEQTKGQTKCLGTDPRDRFTEGAWERANRVRKKYDKQRPVEFSSQPAENIRLPKGVEKVDAVSYFFVLHHLKSASDAIDEALRVLNDDGIICITEDLPTKEQEASWHKEDRKLNWEEKGAEHHYLSVEDWEAFFKNKGLEVVERRIFKEGYHDKVPIGRVSYILRKIALKE